MSTHTEADAFRRWFVLGMAMCLLVLSGCGEGKESLHEIDHVIPPHWPANLQDAATKITERAERLSSQSGSNEELKQTEAELRELIEWVPEIAADGDLSEEDWLPIYNASEKLRKQSTLIKLGAATPPEVDQLCQLLEAAYASLEKLRASREEDAAMADASNSIPIPATSNPTEPQSTEPQSTEPQSTEPQSTEPQLTEPQLTETQSTETQTTATPVESVEEK